MVVVCVCPPQNPTWGWKYPTSPFVHFCAQKLSFFSTRGVMKPKKTSYYSKSNWNLNCEVKLKFGFHRIGCRVKLGSKSQNCFVFPRAFASWTNPNPFFWLLKQMGALLIIILTQFDRFFPPNGFVLSAFTTGGLLHQLLDCNRLKCSQNTLKKPQLLDTNLGKISKWIVHHLELV